MESEASTVPGPTHAPSSVRPLAATPLPSLTTWNIALLAQPVFLPLDSPTQIVLLIAAVTFQKTRIGLCNMSAPNPSTAPRVE